MTFTEPKLHYKAIQYANNAVRPEWQPTTMPLTQTAPGEYGAGPNQILVKVLAAALNALDSYIYNSYSQIFGMLFGLAGIGFDVSGTVVSIGSAAAKKTDLAVGDEITGLYVHPFSIGTVSEYVMFDAKKDLGITRKPKAMDIDNAASWPILYGTAHQTLEVTKVQEGDKVLVIGGNTGVGRLAVQLLKKYKKAGTIVAVCSARSADNVKKLGADEIIDYSQYKSLKEPVEKEAATARFDAILDYVGNSDLFGSMLQILRQNGHYVSISGEQKQDYRTQNIRNMVYHGVFSMSRALLCALGINKYSYLLFALSPGPWIHDGAQRIDEGLVVAPGKVFPIDEFSQAFELLRSGKTAEKIIVHIQ